MDEFERDFPGFDWRETPSNMHPGGIEACLCPRCEVVRIMEKEKSGLFRFCRDHEIGFYEEIAKGKLWQRIIVQLAMRLKIIRIVVVSEMDSDQCFACKYGSGGTHHVKTVKPIP